MFVVLTGVPLAALGWLAQRVLEQDRALEAQRLDTAVNQLARTVETTLFAWEGLAVKAATDGDAGSLPAGSIAVVVDGAGVSWRSGVRLPYYPRVPPAHDLLPERLFAVAETLEMKEGNLIRAADAYQAVASSSPRAVRPVALSRVARVLRKAGRLEDASQRLTRLLAESHRLRSESLIDLRGARTSVTGPRTARPPPT